MEAYCAFGLLLTSRTQATQSSHAAGSSVPPSGSIVMSARRVWVRLFGGLFCALWGGVALAAGIVSALH
jgi:hypothetical protein